MSKDKKVNKKDGGEVKKFNWKGCIKENAKGKGFKGAIAYCKAEKAKA